MSKEGNNIISNDGIKSRLHRDSLLINSSGVDLNNQIQLSFPQSAENKIAKANKKKKSKRRLKKRIKHKKSESPAIVKSCEDPHISQESISKSPELEKPAYLEILKKFSKYYQCEKPRVSAKIFVSKPIDPTNLAKLFYNNKRIQRNSSLRDEKKLESTPFRRLSMMKTVNTKSLIEEHSSNIYQNMISKLDIEQK